jgi:hypothetical protein
MEASGSLPCTIFAWEDTYGRRRSERQLRNDALGLENCVLLGCLYVILAHISVPLSCNLYSYLYVILAHISVPVSCNLYSYLYVILAQISVPSVVICTVICT